MTLPLPQGDGAQTPFVAPEDDRSEMGVLPGWEWVRSLARRRPSVIAHITEHPWTLFGEVRGPLTVVTNGWFLLAIEGDVGYPVASGMDAARLREAVRRRPSQAGTRIVAFSQLRGFLGLHPTDREATCTTCHRRHRIPCANCGNFDAVTFRPPCAQCEGHGFVDCPTCTVSNFPLIEPLRIGIGVFNRAVLAPAMRYLPGENGTWRQDAADEPALIRTEGWSLLVMPIKPDAYRDRRVPSYRPLEVA